MRNGYVVQSRRGGGGFIRICSLFTAPEGALRGQFEEKAEEDARAALCVLARRGLFTKREFLILGTVLEVLERSLPRGEGDELLLEVVRTLAHKGFF
ncbi:putative Transcriptional regulator [Syntrophaceticus schinkii]|uniref:Putative Transcriptional regulator n=1 Tax=Syntrophaceticus schinkii TaxID=499207 RepID=A0A0B7MSE7_9FIRM|nr:putative Transcriptional regulator [Syntrophaceticus schinkii]